MFSREIVGSDAFLDMPTSSQLLYFHLGMEADDDGFIGNPKKVSRFIGASDDDLKILLSKKFLILFQSGVVVVKHHRMNNNWDKYNCKRTVYLEEFSQLNIKENKAYTLDKTQGIPLQSENSLKTVFRIEENRIDKKRIDTSDKSHELISEVIKAFESVDPKNKTYYGNKTQRASADFLLKEYGMDKVLQAVKVLPKINQKKLYIKQITTPYELKENWVKIGNAIKQDKGESRLII